MAVRHIPPGGDFDHPSSFGFSKSAAPAPRPQAKPQAKATGGTVKKFALGGNTGDPLTPYAALGTSMGPDATYGTPMGGPSAALGTRQLAQLGTKMPNPVATLGTPGTAPQSVGPFPWSESHWSPGDPWPSNWPAQLEGKLPLPAVQGTIISGAGGPAAAVGARTGATGAMYAGGKVQKRAKGGRISPLRASREAAEGKAKGGFIKGAVKHPGRMTNLAKKHGVSVHQEMESDKHSKDPSLRSAANLGLRLTGGDLSPRRKKG